MTHELKEVTKEDLRAQLGLLTREELKEVNKLAIKEFLKEEKEQVEKRVGKWIINIFFSSLIATLAYLMLTANGWHHK